MYINYIYNIVNENVYTMYVRILINKKIMVRSEVSAIFSSQNIKRTIGDYKTSIT